MSRQRRNFSAKFKSDLVIELLKGEKDLNTLATENNIQPNLLRNQCHLVNQFQIKIQWFSFRESHCFFSSKT